MFARLMDKARALGQAVLWLAAAGALHAEPALQLEGVVHVRSTFSSGQLALEEIAGQAMAQGIGVLVLGDADVLRVEYGLPFVRRLVRLGWEEEALFSNGRLGAYLEEIRRVQARFPELILIDGVESRPYYYWEKVWGQGPWRLRQWNKRLLAIGLGSEEAYAGLPVSGSGNISLWDWSSLLLMWPLAGLAYLLLGRGHPLSLRLAVGILSLIGLANNAPFRVSLWDAYRGDLGMAPYQCYIDYVNLRGGLVLWAQPDQRGVQEPLLLWEGRIGALGALPLLDEELMDTYDYAGLAALHADKVETAEPGRQWDRILQEHLQQERRRPVWAYGDGDGEGGLQPDGVRTIFLVEERTRQGVLDALRQGRLYASSGGAERLVLEEFAVAMEEQRAGAGQRLEGQGPVRVLARIHGAGGDAEPVRVRLVRSGAVIAQLSGSTPLEVSHLDGELAAGEKRYYRLLAYGHASRLVSNPIFVAGAGP